MVDGINCLDTASKLAFFVRVVEFPGNLFIFEAVNEDFEMDDADKCEVFFSVRLSTPVHLVTCTSRCQ